MDGKSISSSPPATAQAVAPFVAKAYQMVCDPRTDELVVWGKRDNSFLVLDPASFSQLLLPAYFRHNNFSSFIRQLNTYGFRKVDPDKWEFAHESFLRGQKHLLPLIHRRKKKAEIGESGRGYAELKKGVIEMEREDEDVVVKELGSLKEEQNVLEHELQGMTKRLRSTERKPNQMMLFLSKLVDDPDLIVKQLAEAKKRRLISTNSSPSPPSQDSQPLQISSPPADVSRSTIFYPLTTPGGLLGLNQRYCFPANFPDHISGSTVYSGEVNISGASGPQIGFVGVDHQLLGSQILYFPELALAPAAASGSSNSINHGFLSNL